MQVQMRETPILLCSTVMQLVFLLRECVRGLHTAEGP